MTLERWQIKADLDVHYRNMLRSGCTFEELQQSGFIDDGLKSHIRYHPSWDLKWMTTPFQKMSNNMLGVPKGQRCVVLLTTGSFSPLHRGHIIMMERAREIALQRGDYVVGGYMSASHDEYVSRKKNGEAAWHAEYRLAWMGAALHQHAWLDVCAWEARYAPTSLNFTDVKERLQAYLRKHLHNKKIDVVYVFGEDNMAFSRAFEKEHDWICVPRIQRSTDDINQMQEEDWSSTLVRQGFTEGLPAEVLHAYNPNQDDGAKKTRAIDQRYYLIRDDVDHAISKWGPFTEEAGKDWMDRLTQIFAKYLPEHIHCHTMRHSNFICTTTNRPILSLDSIYQGDASLHVSRVFDVSSVQIKNRYIGPRPGYPTLHKQLDDLAYKYPRTMWTLLDDDIATGSTSQFVQSLLRDYGMQWDETVFLNEMWLKQQNMRPYRVHDVVDARDFMLGAHDGGLVVNMPDGTIGRAPYILPYVHLGSRARLDAKIMMLFSYDVLQLNVRWFTQYAPEITLGECDTATRHFWRHMGFEHHARLIDVAQHELERLGAVIRSHKSFQQ